MVQNACWLNRLVVSCILLTGSCIHIQAQSWPKLDLDVQTFPNAYLIQVATADGKNVKTDLHLHAVVKNQGFRSASTICSRKFVIKQGTSTAQVELVCMPNDQGWSSDTIIIETDENERFNRGDYLVTQLWPNQSVDQNVRQILYVSDNITSVAGQSVTATTTNQSTPWSTAVGVADPKKLPTFDHLLPVYESSGQISAGSVNGALSMLQTLQNTQNPISCITTADFFEDWKTLTYTTTILISDSDLASLAKSAAKLRALQNWFLAGGQLVVFDAGKEFEQRTKIVNSICGGDPGELKWYAPSDSLKKKKGFAVNYIWNSTSRDEVFQISDLPNTAKTEIETFKDQSLVMASIGQGELFLTNSDMTAATKKQWQLLVNSWHSRGTILEFIGTNCQRGGFQQSFRIPGIGKPPVLAFQILIGLYVMLIGPLLYYFLHSSGRLYLLLVSIPLVSTLAVGALFLYGIINDGFSIRGRVKSVSFVDERLDKSITHSRQVYYSGVRPEANVYDQNVFVTCSRSANSTILRLRNEDERQVLSGGHIRARSPFQLTTVEVADTGCGVSFSKNSGGESGSVVNRYPDRILFGLLRTQDGYFKATEIDPETAGSAVKVTPADASVELRNYTNRIQTGVNYENGRYRSDYSRNDPYHWGISTDLVSDLNGGHPKLNDVVPLNGYLLVLESNDFMPNPQPSAIIGENRLHVIIGKW